MATDSSFWVTITEYIYLYNPLHELANKEKAAGSKALSEMLDLMDRAWPDAVRRLSPAQARIIDCSWGGCSDDASLAATFGKTDRWIRMQRREALESLCDFYRNECGINIYVNESAHQLSEERGL